MRGLARGQRRSFNTDPIATVDYHLDLDYRGDGLAAHRLDVLTPHAAGRTLPVYIYLHGGGWTSGDKSALTKYCASQAREGMVVVNVNYRRAPAFRMRDILQDAVAAVDWVAGNIGRYGGDPERIVLGGDSAGGQITALVAATRHHPELAEHYGIAPSAARWSLRGLVQHCSIVDFSVLFERGFILSLNFIRMLLPASPRRRPGARRLPARERNRALMAASRFLSPIEWLHRGFPPVFVSTSVRDYFYRANLNFIQALRRHGIAVESVVFGRQSPNARHTWQQDPRYPESQEVYRTLRRFVHRVSAPVGALHGTAPA